LSTAGIELITATTSYLGGNVLWMNIGLHGFLPINTVIGSQ
jgi:hypothetical protein